MSSWQPCWWRARSFLDSIPCSRCTSSGPDLDGEGDEHPGVGAEGVDRRDRLLGFGVTSRVMMDSRWTAPRLILVSLAPVGRQVI